MSETAEERTVRDTLAEALEDDGIGMPSQPVVPLVGSVNVSVNKEEERDIE